MQLKYRNGHDVKRASGSMELQHLHASWEHRFASDETDGYFILTFFWDDKLEEDLEALKGKTLVFTDSGPTFSIECTITIDSIISLHRTKNQQHILCSCAFEIIEIEEKST